MARTIRSRPDKPTSTLFENKPTGTCCGVARVPFLHDNGGMEMRYLKDPSDIIGQVFGKLRVIQYIGVVNGKSEYLCECGCGKRKAVRRNSLMSGNSTTCGNCTSIIDEGEVCRYICQSGDSFLFSPSDRDLIKKHRWRLNNQGYALTSIGRKNVRLQ